MTLVRARLVIKCRMTLSWHCTAHLRVGLSQAVLRIERSEPRSAQRTLKAMLSNCLTFASSPSILSSRHLLSILYVHEVSQSCRRS